MHNQSQRRKFPRRLLIYVRTFGIFLLIAISLFGLYELVKLSPESIRADLRSKSALPVSTIEIRDSPTFSTTLFLPLQLKPATQVNLTSRITHLSVQLPYPLADQSGNWCTWGYCTLSPRLYHEPLADGRYLVGWTDSNGNGHMSTISSLGKIERTTHFPAQSVHGLVAHPDGNYAVLLWDASAKTMWLSTRKADGSKIWQTNINSELTQYDSQVGDSRLAYGNGLYAAYFSVFGISGWVAGHNGDQLSYVDNNGSLQPGGWDWGCSHSMAELVTYHPTLNRFLPLCSSDCFASKGILINTAQVVYKCDGDCSGRVSAQFGQAAMNDSSWKIVFSALNKPCCSGQGIGLATIDGAFKSSYIWLTNTNGEDERDPILARLGSSLQSDRYLTGWRTVDDGAYWIGVINGDGNFLSGPEILSSPIFKWGNRDDSTRTRPDGRVSWVQGDALATTLNIFVFNGDSYLQ